MIVQCDNCKTRFRIADEKMRPTGVKVRCSRCKAVFNVMPGGGITSAGPPADPFGNRPPPPVNAPTAPLGYDPRAALSQPVPAQPATTQPLDWQAPEPLTQRAPLAPRGRNDSMFGAAPSAPSPDELFSPNSLPPARGESLLPRAQPPRGDSLFGQAAPQDPAFGRQAPGRQDSLFPTAQFALPGAQQSAPPPLGLDSQFPPPPGFGQPPPAPPSSAPPLAFSSIEPFATPAQVPAAPAPSSGSYEAVTNPAYPAAAPDPLSSSFPPPTLDFTSAPPAGPPAFSPPAFGAPPFAAPQGADPEMASLLEPSGAAVRRKRASAAPEDSGMAVIPMPSVAPAGPPGFAPPPFPPPQLGPPARQDEFGNVDLGGDLDLGGPSLGLDLDRPSAPVLPPPPAPANDLAAQLGARAGVEEPPADGEGGPTATAIARLNLKKLGRRADGTLISDEATDSKTRVARLDDPALGGPRVDRADVLRSVLVAALVAAMVFGALLVRAGGEVSRIDQALILEILGRKPTYLTEGAIPDVRVERAHATTYKTANGAHLLVVAGQARNAGSAELAGVRAVVLVLEGEKVVEQRRGWLGVAVGEDALWRSTSDADLKAAFAAAEAKMSPAPAEVVLGAGKALDFMIVFPEVPEGIASRLFRVEFERGGKLASR